MRRKVNTARLAAMADVRRKRKVGWRTSNPLHQPAGAREIVPCEAARVQTQAGSPKAPAAPAGPARSRQNPIFLGSKEHTCRFFGRKSHKTVKNALASFRARLLSVGPNQRSPNGYTTFQVTTH